MDATAGHRPLAVLLSLASLHSAPAAAQETGSHRLHLQVEAGALNAREPLQATIAYGLGAGMDLGRYSLLAHVVRQSQNRNTGSDLTTNARTFTTLSVERRFGTPRGWPLRQGFLRVSAGFLFRRPYRTAPVTGIGVGWRQSLTSHVRLVGALFDDVAWLPGETFACEPVWPAVSATCGIQSGPQHNFGGMAALQLHL
jgi:hypothetical protein